MSKRRASIVSDLHGATGVLHMPADHRLNRKQHPADGARVMVVTNRFSGLLVEFTHNHGIYDKGERIQVASQDIVFGQMAAHKLSIKGK